MVTSFNWIKDLVPGLNVTPEDFRDAMTLSGSKVETEAGLILSEAELDEAAGGYPKVQNPPSPMG